MESGLDLDFGGCLPALLVVFVVAAILAGLVLVPGAIGRANEAIAERNETRVAEIRAQADLEQTRSVAWQKKFMLWTAYLEHRQEPAPGSPWLGAVIGAVAGIVAGGVLCLLLLRSGGAIAGTFQE